MESHWRPSLFRLVQTPRLAFIRIPSTHKSSRFANNNKHAARGECSLTSRVYTMERAIRFPLQACSRSRRRKGAALELVVARVVRAAAMAAPCCVVWGGRMVWTCGSDEGEAAKAEKHRRQGEEKERRWSSWWPASSALPWLLPVGYVGGGWTCGNGDSEGGSEGREASLTPVLAMGKRDRQTTRTPLHQTHHTNKQGKYAGLWRVELCGNSSTKQHQKSSLLQLQPPLPPLPPQSPPPRLAPPQK